MAGSPLTNLCLCDACTCDTWDVDEFTVAPGFGFWSACFEVWSCRQHASLSPSPRRLSNPALSPCGQHMREAAERRQQLELEHEQALAVLNAKQQEIDLLQKVGGRSAQVWTHSHVRSGSGSTPAALLGGTGDPDSIEMTSESVKIVT